MREETNESEDITYEQHVTYCGKPTCTRCSDGIGHGPYWYAYQTMNGRTRRTYIGKNLPVGVKGKEKPGEVKAVVKVITLGRFRLERLTSQHQWESVPDAAWRTHDNARLLLCYLISQPNRSATERQLCSSLWPDANESESEATLMQSQHLLSQLLTPKRTRHHVPLFHREGGWVTLAGQQDMWCDADVLEELLAGSSDTFEEAMNLYGGDYLPALHASWTAPRRQHLHRLWATLVLNRADRSLERGEMVQAIKWLEDLFLREPTNEAVMQRILVAFSHTKRRIEALRLYQRFAEMLLREGLTPSVETVAMYEAVRKGDRVAIPMQTPLGTSSAMETTFAVERAENLEQEQYEERYHLAPMVGREKEYQRLVAYIERVQGQGTSSQVLARQGKAYRGEANCILLQGDAGIGKTRLAEEVASEARRRGWTVVWSHAYTQESHMPYHLWAELLRKLLKQSLWLRQEIGRNPLLYYPLAALAPDLQEVLPHVAPYTSQVTEPLRIWEAITSFFALVSETVPVLLVLDDLQWADGSSHELLAAFLRRRSAGNVLVLGTCRGQEAQVPQTLSGILADLQRERLVDILSLNRLTDEQIALLVSQIAHPDKTIVDYIMTYSAGNPLFAQELAQFSPMVQRGEVPGPQAHALSLLPNTIAGILEHRLQKLSAQGQQLMKKASVIGGAFTFSTLFELNCVSSTDAFDASHVLDLLEEAIRVGVLREERVGTHIGYQFWHPLLYSHLYESIALTRRARLHHHVANVLRQEYGDEEAAAITYHLVQAGDADELIVRYAERAAFSAYTLSAYPVAERYYRLAVQHHRGNDLLRAVLLEGQGECLRVQGRHETAGECYERAFETRLHLPGDDSPYDRQREAQIEALLACEVGQTKYDGGNYEHALRWYTRGEQTLQDANVLDGPAVARIRLEQGYVRWRQADYESARPLAQEALALFTNALQKASRRDTHPSYETRLQRTLVGDPVDVGRAHVLLGLIANGAGKATEAATHLHNALSMYEQGDRQREIAIVCCDLGDLYARRAEFGQAHHMLRRSLQVAERIGDIPVMAFALGNGGILALRTGKLIEAETSFKRAVELCEQLEDVASLSLWLIYSAEALREQGMLREARPLLARALRLARRTGISPYLALALVATANIHLSRTLLRTGPSTHEAIRKMQVYLLRALRAVQRASAIDGIEAETKTEALLTLAQIEWSLREREQALVHVQHAIAEAHVHVQTWLQARGEHLLGTFLLDQGQQDQALLLFKKALSTFQAVDMRLEYGRVLSASALVFTAPLVDEQQISRAIDSLREARRLFLECHASLDVQSVEYALSALTTKQSF